VEESSNFQKYFVIWLLPSAVRRMPSTEPDVSFPPLFAYNIPMSTIAIILAGGSGERFQGPEPKQFLKIGDKTLLAICLERFQGHPGVDGIVLVCPAASLARARKIVAGGAFSKVARVLAGGKTRQESSALGVAALPAKTGSVLIHDAARALVPAAVITRVLETLAGEAAVMPVIPAGDTTVRIDGAGQVTAVLDREKLRRVQTPQGFRSGIIIQAHELARQEGYRDAGDDCSLVLRYNLAPVSTVAGDADNIKITYPADMLIAETILKLS
jgi:2-C-methyl-D-erythritol 4-phosphate cytidylyltransferase